jgi:hypothetical protein
MEPELEKLLKEGTQETVVARPKAMERARAASLQALQAQPVSPPWRRSAYAWLAMMVGLWLAVGVVGLASRAVSLDFLLHRAPTLALVFASQAVCLWAALAPRAVRLRLPAVALGVVTMAGLIVARGSGPHPSEWPGWVCSASHLAVDALPLWMALRILRGMAPASGRSLAAGLAAGATGAQVGELACGQGWQHVALYHASVWMFAAAICLFIARISKPHSYAP